MFFDVVQYLFGRLLGFFHVSAFVQRCGIDYHLHVFLCAQDQDMHVFVEDFNLVGSIDDAIEKGKKLLAQAQG